MHLKFLNCVISANLHITPLFIDLNEDDFLPSHHTYTLQGKKLQDISYQVMWIFNIYTAFCENHLVIDVYTVYSTYSYSYFVFSFVIDMTMSLWIGI